VKQSDTDRFALFFQKLLAEGVYFSPSAFEANFMSVTHTDAHLGKTLKAVEKVIKTL
jgi:glutamate-1-semialdehyde 2,1-aminomutase